MTPMIDLAVHVPAPSSRTAGRGTTARGGGHSADRPAGSFDAAVDAAVAERGGRDHSGTADVNGTRGSSPKKHGDKDSRDSSPATEPIVAVTLAGDQQAVARGAAGSAHDGAAGSAGDEVDGVSLDGRAGRGPRTSVHSSTSVHSTDGPGTPGAATAHAGDMAADGKHVASDVLASTDETAGHTPTISGKDAETRGQDANKLANLAANAAAQKVAGTAAEHSTAGKSAAGNSADHASDASTSTSHETAGATTKLGNGADALSTATSGATRAGTGTGATAAGTGPATGAATGAAGAASTTSGFDAALGSVMGRPHGSGDDASAGGTSTGGSAAGTAPATSSTAALSPTAVPLHTAAGPAAAAPAAAAAPPASATQPPMQPALTGSLLQLHGAGDGTYQLRVSLHPAELGAVGVTATMHQGTLTVLLSPDHTAQQAVSQALPQLRQQLLDAGFAGVDVGLGAPGQQAQQDQAAARDAGRTSAARGIGGVGGVDGISDGPVDATAIGARHGSASSLSALDRWL